MHSDLVIAVPSSVATQYVVVTDDPVPDPHQLARDLARSPEAAPASSDAVGEWIGSPQLAFRSVSAADSPCRKELARMDLDEDVRHRLLAAPWHLIVGSDAAPGRHPLLARLVRGLARAVGDHVGGLVADTCTAQLVTPIGGVDGERDWFRLADGWLAVRCRTDPRADTCVSPTFCCGCLCLFTQGMSRFGLPELLIDPVRCSHDLAATNLLRGLAVRLLAQLWAHPGVRQLHPGQSVVVEPDDMWGYWGARPLFGQPVPIHIHDPNSGRADLPAGRRYLHVQPQPIVDGSRLTWPDDVLADGLPSVAGWQPDAPPYRIDHPGPGHADRAHRSDHADTADGTGVGGTARG